MGTLALIGICGLAGVLLSDEDHSRISRSPNMVTRAVHRLGHGPATGSQARSGQRIRAPQHPAGENPLRDRYCKVVFELRPACPVVGVEGILAFEPRRNPHGDGVAPRCPTGVKHLG